MFIGESTFEPLPPDAPLPADVAAQPQAKPAIYAPSPPGAVLDLRLSEGKGHYVFNHADANFPPLELCNVTWEPSDGRSALRFHHHVKDGETNFARGGTLEFFLFAHDAYHKGKTKSVAIAGSHGSPQRNYKALTLATWVRPAATMTKGQPIADILGFGSRCVRLELLGEQAPYQCGGRFTEGGPFLWSGPDATLAADRWHHLALTAEVNANQQWDIRLFLNGKMVQQRTNQSGPVPLQAHDSIVLGTELHYMHDNYYHGLIGRTLIFDRALSADEIAQLMKLP